jgi:hypothetical protein
LRENLNWIRKGSSKEWQKGVQGSNGPNADRELDTEAEFEEEGDVLLKAAELPKGLVEGVMREPKTLEDLEIGARDAEG